MPARARSRTPRSGVTALAVALAWGCGSERPIRTGPEADRGAHSENPARPDVSSEPIEPAGVCTLSIGPEADLAETISAAPDGARVCLSPGRYEANLVVTRSVTLHALGAAAETVIDGGERGPILAVRDDELTVRFEGLSLTRGSASQGGAVLLTGLSRVELHGCALHHNTGRQGPGGAIYADQGTVVIERCRIHDNAATDGPAVCVDGIASLRIEDSLLVESGGPTVAVVRVRDGADATVARSTLIGEDRAAALHASGTSSRRPEVAVSDSVLSGSTALDLPEPFAGKATVTRSLLSAVTHAYIDGGDTRVGAPRFAGGPEPHAPAADSPACGMALGKGSDLAGKQRPRLGACAGAFEP